MITFPDLEISYAESVFLSSLFLKFQVVESSHGSFPGNFFILGPEIPPGPK